MSLRMMTIASGSSGNCIYIGSDETNILIDTGISMKRINEGLKGIGLTGADIDAVFVTHEHSDHIGGLGVFMRKYKMPVFSAAGTIEEIKTYKNIGKIPSEVAFCPITPDVSFDFRDLTIDPMSVSHDAACPLAYRVNAHKGGSAAVVTDLGFYHTGLVDRLQGLDAMVLESNHDLRMLEVGPYPYYLKRRIAGDYGHLSNETCGRLLDEILHKDVKKVLLGHLSKENNMPPLALETVKTELEMSASCWSGDQFSILAAPRDKASEVIYIE